MPQAITPQDFPSTPADPARDRWTAGKMRHVVNGLDGAEVVIVTNVTSGSAARGRLVGVSDTGSRNDGARVHVEATLSDGTKQVTWYRLDRTGVVIDLSPSPRARHRSYSSWLAEGSAAIDYAKTRWPEHRDGTWSVTARATHHLWVSFQPAGTAIYEARTYQVMVSDLAAPAPVGV